MQQADVRGEFSDIMGRRRDQPIPDLDVVAARAEFDGHAGESGGRASKSGNGASCRRCDGFCRKLRQVLVEQREDFVDDGIVRPVARRDGEIGERIDRIALLDQPLQGQFGIGMPEQRAVGALAHAPRQDLEIGLQPDRDGMFGDRFAGRGQHIGAAARGHHLLPAGQQAGDDLPFALPELGFAVLGENIRDRHSGGGFDFAVGVGEGQAETTCETTPDGRLSGPHHADEDERTSAEARDERARIRPRTSRRSANFLLIRPVSGARNWSYPATTTPYRRI